MFNSRTIRHYQRERACHSASLPTTQPETATRKPTNSSPMTKPVMYPLSGLSEHFARGRTIARAEITLAADQTQLPQ